jgi:hypothetical protein
MIESGLLDLDLIRTSAQLQFEPALVIRSQAPYDSAFLLQRFQLAEVSKQF